MYNFTIRLETTSGVEIIRRKAYASSAGIAAQRITRDILNEYGKANVIAVEAMSYIYMEV